MDKLWRNRNQVLGGLLLLVIFNLWSWYSTSSHGLLQVIVLDVGQGDAIFVRTPENKQILIDGGPGDAVIQELGQKMPFWDRDLDMVILTHPHADHLSGILALTDRYNIDIVLTTDFVYDSSEYRAWVDYLSNHNKIVRLAKSTQTIQVSAGVTIDILYPFMSLATDPPSNVNDASIVLKLKYKEFSMLLTGDAECTVQDQIATRTPDVLDVEILKVAHHGSKDSACPEFIKLASPTKALISVGVDNRFGHPHQEQIDLLELMIPDRSGQEIYRTDQDGEILLESDGTKYWIKTER
jgi:competence protein ComEC